METTMKTIAIEYAVQVNDGHGWLYIDEFYDETDDSEKALWTDHQDAEHIRRHCAHDLQQTRIFTRKITYTQPNN